MSEDNKKDSKIKIKSIFKTFGKVNKEIDKSRLAFFFAVNKMTKAAQEIAKDLNDTQAYTASRILKSKQVHDSLLNQKKHFRSAGDSVDDDYNLNVINPYRSLKESTKRVNQLAKQLNDD